MCAPLTAWGQNIDTSAIEGQISELRGQLDKEKTRERRIRTELLQLSRQTQRSKDRIAALEPQLAAGRQRLGQLQRQAQPMQDKLAAQQKKVGALMRMIHRMGPARELQVFLRPDQPQKLSRIRGYHRFFRDARSRHIRRYRKDLATLLVVEQQQREATEALQNRRNEMAAEELSLKRLIDRNNDSLVLLQRSIAVNNTKLEKLLQLVRSVKRPPVAPPKAFKSMIGKLQQPVAGRRLNSFGAFRVGKQLRWNGIQFVADRGQLVHALYDGQVIYADSFGRFGLLIVVDHGDDYQSLYAYNETLLQDLDAQIRAAQPIATVGPNPNGSQSVLYMEVRHRGRAVDPVRWLRR